MIRGVVVFATLADAEVSGLGGTYTDFQAYKLKFRKSYAETEDQDRFNIFQESVARINKANSLNGEHVFGLTATTDLKPHEKQQKGYKRNEKVQRDLDVVAVDAPKHPASIDWTLTEAVTPIKNQGQCGSCWAFSATETIESHFIISEGLEYGVSLSPQQVASCTKADYGCGGGEPMDAYDYIMSVPGLTNEWNWPYVQSMTQADDTAPCNRKKEKAINGTLEVLEGRYAQISGYKWATPPCQDPACFTQDLKKLAESLEVGPVSVCVDATMFNDYVGGILTANACGPAGGMFLDHCVQLVGFNNNGDDMAYWIVRNSWGTEWGVNGNIYLEMEYNTCGVADEATVPIIANANQEHLPKFQERAFTHRETINV